MKKISSLIFTIACCGLLLTSCQKPFKMDHTLLVDRDEFYLTAAEGSATVIVYANGSWTAQFENKISWAELEIVDNGSLQGFRVKYKANTNISRGVNILVKSGGEEKKVYFAQKAGMSAPMIVFEKSNISLLKVGTTLQLSMNTNLTDEDLDKMQVETKYVTEGDPGGWLTDFHREGESVIFTIADNISGADRSVVVNVEVPGAYPGEGAGSSITVNQSKEDVKVSFTTGDLVLSGMSQNFAYGYKINFDPDLYTEYSMKYGFVDAEAKTVDWVKNVELATSTLNGRVRVNQDVTREATAFIEILKDSESVAKVTAKLTQERADVEITEGDGDEKQDKDNPEEF